MDIKAGDLVLLKKDDEPISVESVDFESKTFLVDAGDGYKYEYEINDVERVFREVK